MTTDLTLAANARRVLAAPASALAQHFGLTAQAVVEAGLSCVAP